MAADSIKLIPLFIASPDKKGLVSMMAKLNMVTGKFHEYHILQDVDTKEWVAWFYEQVELKIDLKNKEVKIDEDSI